MRCAAGGRRTSTRALLAAFEEAAGARLVTEVAGPSPLPLRPRPGARHPLQRLSAARRVALHRRVAEAIETLHAGRPRRPPPGPRPPLGPGGAPAADTARAVDYAARAGDRALAQLAHDEAAVYYQQASTSSTLAEPPQETAGCELLISLGEAQRRAGEPAHRQILFAGRLARPSCRGRPGAALGPRWPTAGASSAGLREDRRRAGVRPGVCDRSVSAGRLVHPGRPPGAPGGRAGVFA